jgi:hypothetical protein
VIVLVALAVFLAVPAAAAEPAWTVRLHGAWDKPNLDLAKVDSAVPVHASANGAPGAGASLEYRLHRWVALGVDALHARPDIVLEAALPGGRLKVSDKLGFTPVTIGPVFHVAPARTIDLSFAAMLGFAVHGDLRFAAGAETLNLQGDRAVCWGLGAAVDIYPGASRWAIHAGVRRYESNPEFSNRDNGASGSAAFNPVVVTFGVVHRF